MLRMLRTAETEDKVTALAGEIISSGSAAEVFEYLADETTRPILLPLLTASYANFRSRDGVAADLKNVGFSALWRIARNTLEWSAIEPWLIEELQKCIPGHLRLVNSIYYYWLGDRHTPNERERSRQAVFDKCKTEF